VVPGSPTDRCAPQVTAFAEVLTDENLDAAIIAIPPKQGADVGSGVTEKLQGLQTALGRLGQEEADQDAGTRHRRRRLASTIKDDVETWVEEDRSPCAAVPVFMPTPKFVAAAAAARLAGSVAVVIGASGPPDKGVGRALADQLVDAGVTVIGTSRNPSDPANAGISARYDLLRLDMSSQASVDAFAAAVAAHPAVQAKGLATLFLNGARFAAGSPGPPPLQDEEMYYSGAELSLQTNFLGPLRVTHALWPLLEAYAAGAGPAPVPPGPRLIWTGSAEAYAIGGADSISYSYWSYGAAKRASLAYYNAMRTVLTNQSSPVTTAALYPFGINTRLVEGTRPIFLSPVNARGEPIDNPHFSLVMGMYRFFLSMALSPAFVAAGDIELATMADPPINVASSSWAWKPQGESRLGGLQDLWDSVHQIEELQSAFPFELGKADAAKKA
jgi:NAD(P)-dependent dehydrogenase (short-subunit alcohol dehydrogenase family)